MRVISIPVLADNYSYLVIDGTYVAIVDPSEHTKVREAIAREGVQLSAIWLTHHHWDHVGGVAELAKSGIPVYGHDSDRSRLPSITHPLQDGDTIALPSATCTIIHNPGHTLGAISYVVDQLSASPSGDAARPGEAGAFAGCVFTGDTLFGAGCGRVFEGTMEMMHASLQRLAALPPDTRVYFGHEYTASNLRFAAHVEPDNDAVKTRAATTTSPSTPSTIALELATNPFMRAKDAAELATRRTAKDSFK